MKKKKLEEITDNIIKEVRERLLLEMSTIGRISDGNRQYRIAIHGPASGDRPMPHIHIYSAVDVFPYNQFNFEISLTDLVCKDEITLVAQTDKMNNLRRTSKEKCNWEGYRNLYISFRKFLSDPPMKKIYRGKAKNNLEVAIMEWENENNDTMEETNDSLLKQFLESKGFNILPKYLDYFNH